VGLADGDTVTVLDASKVQHKIRLSGIDPPEKNQAYRRHERLLTGVELDNRNAASGERQQLVLRRPLHPNALKAGGGVCGRKPHSRGVVG